jgi:uncharacterized protein YraI
MKMRIKINLRLVVFFLLWAFTLNAQSSKYATTNLNLRSGPGTNYSIIDRIPAGASVDLEQNNGGGWVQIYYDGNYGYVFSKYLRSNSRSVQNGNADYYLNVDGEWVQSPTYYDSQPSGATAVCRDGTYSFSRNRRGTCSHHGGVARWLK